MNIVLMLAHSIEEYDQVRLLSSLGYNVFSIGAYTNPAEPGDTKRPALPDVPYYQDLADACQRKRVEMQAEHGAPEACIDWAKFELPDEVIDWADVIICHHYEHQWLIHQWPRIKGKRVIWRTVGQSVTHNESMMAPLRHEGLERVAYSPKEANIPGYCGHDALIRFYADPAIWHGWTGEEAVIFNHTQQLRQRDPYTNWRAWQYLTKDLPRQTAGPGSDEIGGLGSLPTEALQEQLRRARCYLYTGTQPACYTLGLIEAMMTGIPVVSIGPEWFDIFLYGPGLFEGYDLAGLDLPTAALQRRTLQRLLNEPAYAKEVSKTQHRRALELFGMDRVGAQWKAYLG